MTAFTLAQVKNIVKNIEKKVDIILSAPLQIAFKHFESAVNEVLTRNNKLALESFNELLKQAMQAFEYSRQQGQDLDQLKKTIIAMKLIIVAKIAKFSYNKNKSLFTTFYFWKTLIYKLLSVPLFR